MKTSSCCVYKIDGIKKIIIFCNYRLCFQIASKRGDTSTEILRYAKL